MNSFNNHNPEKLENCAKSVKKFGEISIVLNIIFLICVYTSYHLLFVSKFGLFLSLIVGVISLFLGLIMGIIGCIKVNKLKESLEVLSQQEQNNIKIEKIYSIIGIVLSGIFILTILSYIL